MRISLIVAMAANRVIGNRGEIPWKIPGEQQRFKKITMGHSVIMGRKTYESLGRPLAGRTNIVITRNSEYQAAGCLVVHDFAAALQACPDGEAEAFICGGGQLYRQALPAADRIYLSVLPREVTGDTFFPEIPADEFSIVKSELINGEVPYHFTIYDRIKKP